MSRQDDYRDNAFNSLRLAERAEAASDKLRLLTLAEAWMNLADRAEDSARRSRKKVPSGEIHAPIGEPLEDPHDQA
jgi:hypothetical protein